MDGLWDYNNVWIMGLQYWMDYGITILDGLWDYNYRLIMGLQLWMDYGITIMDGLWDYNYGWIMGLQLWMKCGITIIFMQTVCFWIIIFKLERYGVFLKTKMCTNY